MYTKTMNSSANPWTVPQVTLNYTFSSINDFSFTLFKYITFSMLAPSHLPWHTSAICYFDAVFCALYQKHSYTRICSPQYL